MKYVYFIKPIGMDGPIKIGCSGAPKNRLLSLSYWSPFPLEILATAPGGGNEECLLHRCFSDHHTHHEWFHSSPGLRCLIERIIAGASINDACAELTAKKPIRNQKRPIRTPDRELFLTYGHRIRAAMKKIRCSDGSYYQPSDVSEIMNNWRCDRTKDHLPIIPTDEQFRRLEDFIADPKIHCEFRSWSRAA